MSTAQPAAAELRRALLHARNTDGGWGYHLGKASRLEPTCWALLALGPDAPDRSVLRRWPVSEGLLLERAGGTPNYAFHGLALLTLRALHLEHEHGNSRLLAALQRVKGDTLPPSRINTQDNSLQGWSWIAGTFSWVEPTAWCLLALKRYARMEGMAIDSGRVDSAERLLADRSMPTGGWNYGNSNMLGKVLEPFVPPTAVALLALQDRPSLPAVAHSLEFLERAATTERSGLALSLTLLALGAFGRSTAAVRTALFEQVPTTLAFGNQMAAAMSLFALGTEENHAVFAL
jgi:hypothetical protein